MEKHPNLEVGRAPISLQWRKKLIMVMKCLFFLLLVCHFNVFSEISAQRVARFRMENADLKSCIQQIERLTGIGFLYNGRELEQIKGITLDLQNVEINTILSRLLEGPGYTYEIVNGVVAIKRAVTVNNVDLPQAEKRTVRGVVKDRDGMPLPGVSVLVKGTSSGMATNVDGRFEIKVNDDPNVMLVFSFIGMKSQEMKIGQATTLNVVLEPENKALEEVVVTGYQTISKERATGSFDKVSVEVLNSRPSSDLSNMLQGVVAGMQSTENEDGSVNFLIRGTSSLYANTEPLVVVDGFPIEGTFSSINPNDVESVTVLKDAAAASIWGARSANGVIVVTTKKGKQGKLNVEVQGFYRFNIRPDLDYILAQADSKTTVDYELMAVKNGWFLSEFTPSPTSIAGSLPISQEYYYANKYYGMSEAEMNTNLDRLRRTDNRSQLKKHLMQTQALQQYNVNLSSGTEKNTTYASLMYEKNDEATIKRGYERFMVNFNNTYKFTPWLAASVAGTFQRKKAETSGVTVAELRNLAPYELLLEEDGSYAYNVGSWNRLIAEDLNLQNLPYKDLSYNMLREVCNRKYTTETTRYRFNVGLNAKIWRELVFDTKFQYEKNVADTRQYDNEETDYVRQMVNYYTDYDLSGDVLKNQYIPSGGIIRSSKNSNENYVWRNQLSYNETFGKHDVTALAGMEISEYKTSGTTYPYVVGYNEKTNTSLPAYYGSKESAKTIVGYPDYYNTLATIVQTTYSDRVDRYFSYFANAAYMFDGRYGASFSIRADGSNYVTDDKSLRWSPMWSAGLKWNMSNESFLEAASSWVDRLTLRLTYGINGNAEKSTSPQTLISTSANVTTGTNVSRVISYGNPLLRWEETYTTNVGVDFSFFKNALSGKVEYYNRLGKYIIGTVTVPSVYGSKEQRFNNAEILNRGVELELTGQGQVRSIGLNISSTVTFAYNKNKVQKLFYPSLYCHQLAYASDPSNGYFIEGKPVGAVYSYDYAGVRDGVPHVKTMDGNEWTFNDLTLHNRTLGLDKMYYGGTTIAPASFGWANSFSWKGLNLYVYMTGNFGGKFRAPTAESVPLANSKNTISKFITRLMESDGTTFPTLPAPGDYMCYRWGRYLPYLRGNVEDASFIRLKEVTLSYYLPEQWLRSIRLQKAKVFVQARDLGMVWTANKNNYDPEWLPGTNKPSTSFTFGASFNF